VVVLDTYLYFVMVLLLTDMQNIMVPTSVADPDRFGPDPDPTSENRPDPVLDPDSSK
jgi:hypothetical protein